MDYKLTIYPALQESCGDDQSYTSYLFETKSELSAALYTAADLLLFVQDKMGVMDDYSNSFVAEERQGYRWVEIEV